MAPERLEISRLASNGEVVRKLACLAGRVTVFRANSEPEFDLYRSALAGWKIQERVSVLLDGQTFSPSAHAFIGFGEAYASERGNDTLQQILTESGIPASQIEAALLSFGLGGLGSAACKALSPAQERLLRILACTARNDHIVVLYEPFEVLPEMWREKAAEMLARFAWEKKAIVIVVKLTTRPECWIENEHIARVQLERPRKRTIGFGADSSDAAAFVAQVRKDSAAFDLKKLREEGVGPATQSLIDQILTPRGIIYSCASLALLLLVLLGLVLTRSPGGTVQVTNNQIPNSGSDPGHASVTPGNFVTSPGTNIEDRPKAIAYRGAAVLALDSYSIEIKDAIVLAFSNPDAVLEKQRASYTIPHSVPPVRNIHIDPAPEYPQGVDPLIEGTLDEMSLEARREEIRRRFLAAIQANQ